MATYLTKLGITNLKGFKNPQTFNLRPLTVLCGANSSGKSTVLQTLLLLKKTLMSGDVNTPLLLNSIFPYCDSLSSIANVPGQIEPVGIQFSFSNGMSFEYKFIQGEKNIQIKQLHICDGKECRDIVLTDGYKCLTKLSTPIKLPNGTDLSVEEKNYTVKFDRFIPSGFILSEGKNSYLIPNRYIFKTSGEKAIIEAVEFLKNIAYSAPIRSTEVGAPQPVNAEASFLADDGANIPAFLGKNNEMQVTYDNKTEPLKTAINRALSTLGLEQPVTSTKIADNLYQIEVSKVAAHTEQKLKLSDVGFGYSQVLPVVTKIITAQENTLTLLEQPEVHLHPNASAKLAEVILGCIGGQRHFLVETQSQEFIQTLALMVLQKTELKDAINIIFTERTESGDTVARELTIDECGSMSTWPMGFCDSFENITKRVLEEQIKKANADSHNGSKT